MVYKRYASPFQQQSNTPVPCEPPQPSCSPLACENERKNTIIGGLGCDDIILLGLILILLFDDNDQKDLPLIIALGFLLITGWKN
ncbi:MAG: hypothetical protein IJC06_01285 [Clostridia bacterium]|nr:hypothetical protein [Clostridia bacterium]